MPGSTPKPAKATLPILSNSGLSGNSLSPSFTWQGPILPSGCGSETVMAVSR